MWSRRNCGSKVSLQKPHDCLFFCVSRSSSHRFHSSVPRCQIIQSLSWQDIFDATQSLFCPKYVFNRRDGVLNKRNCIACKSNMLGAANQSSGRKKGGESKLLFQLKCFCKASNLEEKKAIRDVLLIEKNESFAENSGFLEFEEHTFSLRYRKQAAGDFTSSHKLISSRMLIPRKY